MKYEINLAKNNQDKMKEAIIKTIAFFDLFDYPLDAGELHRYLWTGEATDRERLTGLSEALAEEGKLRERDGFYFLPGREESVGQRRASRPEAEKKIKVALKAAKILKFWVGVKLIAVCNSVVMGSVKASSDIDLFVVVPEGRINLSRLIITLIIQLMGLRRNDEVSADKLCLGFYVAADRLDLSGLLYEEDPYFHYWLATLSPVYDDGTYEQLLKENDWLLKRLANYRPRAASGVRAEDSALSKFAKKISRPWFDSFLGRFLEKLAARILYKKMPAVIKQLAREPDSRVVVSDGILKFHHSDRREEFRRRWIESAKRIMKDE